MTIFLVRTYGRAVHDVTVIAEPKAAEVALDPIRSRLLAALATPGSATTLAPQVGLSRQKVNYHLRALERHGLVELVEERRKGNCTERVLQASARSYVVSPAALAGVAPDPGTAPDRLSAQWVVALASRLIGEVGALLAGAERTNRRVATFAIDGDIRFASAADRLAFTQELSDAVATLVARYHHEGAPHGRDHRLLVAVHPAVAEPRPGTSDPSPLAGAITGRSPARAHRPADAAAPDAAPSAAPVAAVPAPAAPTTPTAPTAPPTPSPPGVSNRPTRPAQAPPAQAPSA